jgi:hypothetical protein
LNLQEFNDVRHIEILLHRAKPLVSETTTFDIEMDNEKLKKYIYKSQDTGHIPAE